MKNLFVGNIPFNTTEASLRELFAQYGEIQQVRVMTDRDTGKPRGFAFVEMANDDDALKAIAALHGKALGGRTLTVNEARPKPDRGGPRSGGGGRERHGGRGDYRGSSSERREPRW